MVKIFSKNPKNGGGGHGGGKCGWSEEVIGSGKGMGRKNDRTKCVWGGGMGRERVPKQRVEKG